MDASGLSARPSSISTHGPFTVRNYRAQRRRSVQTSCLPSLFKSNLPCAPVRLLRTIPGGTPTWLSVLALLFGRLLRPRPVPPPSSSRLPSRSAAAIVPERPPGGRSRPSGALGRLLAFPAATWGRSRPSGALLTPPGVPLRPPGAAFAPPGLS